MTKTGGRKINEDNIGVIENNSKKLFIVADGLGGHGHGDYASKISVDKCKEVFLSGENEYLLENCFIESQNKVINEQLRLNSKNDMKTTLVLLQINDKEARWGHIGDSRMYLFRKNKLFKRTLDHSVPQMLVSSNEIKEKDIRNHEDRNRLLRVIGMEWSSPKYQIGEKEIVESGDSFLLCTDGFWELIIEKSMLKYLKISNTPQQWIDYMETEILKNGLNKEMDNYSAIAIFIK